MNKKITLFQVVIRIALALVFGYLAGLSVVLLLTTSASADSLPELVLVNRARQANSLPPLQLSPLLKKAAEAHSHYMAHNYTCSHEEQLDMFAFSGRTPQERALAANYPFRGSFENVSCSNVDSWKDSVDGLMGAIYHRLAFLSYDIDEVGFSHCQSQHHDARPHKFTYMMGNSHFRQLCERVSQTKTLTLPEIQKKGTYLYYFCSHEKAKVEQTLFNRTKQVLPAKSSKIVVYPWPGQREVFPAFLDNEVPDPTPGLQLSGIPISVQFNPVIFNDVEVIAFHLKNSQGQPIDVWRLDSLNDPHKKLSEYEYAWFPIRPLLRGEVYKAQVDYVVNGHKYQKIWSFQTQNHQQEVVWVVEDSGDTVISPKGQRVSIQWRGATNDVISEMSCLCHQCQPRQENFDTVSLWVEQQDVSCELKDKWGQRISFTVRPL